MSEAPPVPANLVAPDPERTDPYLRPMSRILLGGVLLSVAILVIGVVSLFLHGAGTVDTGPATFSAGAWAEALRAGEPEAIFLLGLVVLVLTPLTRVLFSVVMFVEQRDRPFIAMTLFVLALLIIGALAGFAL